MKNIVFLFSFLKETKPKRQKELAYYSAVEDRIQAEMSAEEASKSSISFLFFLRVTFCFWKKLKLVGGKWVSTCWIKDSELKGTLSCDPHPVFFFYYDAMIENFLVRCTLLPITCNSWHTSSNSLFFAQKVWFLECLWRRECCYQQNLK